MDALDRGVLHCLILAALAAGTVFSNWGGFLWLRRMLSEQSREASQQLGWIHCLARRHLSRLDAKSYGIESPGCIERLLQPPG